MDCEICKYFEEHPFARETMEDYCNGYDKWFSEVTSEDILFCPHFEEIEWVE